ncbi:unnamed protein product, partial [Nesidiocoris tenuis]
MIPFPFYDFLTTHYVRELERLKLRGGGIRSISCFWCSTFWFGIVSLARVGWIRDFCSIACYNNYFEPIEIPTYLQVIWSWFWAKDDDQGAYSERSKPMATNGSNEGRGSVKSRRPCIPSHFVLRYARRRYARAENAKNAPDTLP